ncbi:mam domain-containing protein 2 [Limosa lapponica baueri]|uniref:Mam domain-containing protein 2 n=1 Tax=Limosa lapponica baueri TaxID=1758121 RepID=A0A2I0USA8_LIMLA|nr:mam domain-containing protein 2 [Limosa lapponica baueri]
MIKKLEYLSYGGEAETARTGQLREGWGNHINVYKYLTERNTEDGDRCFSVVPSDRTRSNGHTVKCKKFHSNIRKKRVYCETLTQIAQQGFGVSVCGHIQNPAGHGPGQPALADHALRRELDQVISRDPFPPQQLGDAVNVLKCSSR